MAVYPKFVTGKDCSARFAPHGGDSHDYHENIPTEGLWYLHIENPSSRPVRVEFDVKRCWD